MLTRKPLSLLFALLLSLTLVSTDKSRYFEISKNIEIYTNIYKVLNEEHVEGVDPNKLMRIGIDAMLSSLDPYTNFISEAEIEKYRFIENPTKVGSIGASVMQLRNDVVLKEVYQGFAADKAIFTPWERFLRRRWGLSV